jgi:hypothetical protein
VAVASLTAGAALGVAGDRVLTARARAETRSWRESAVARLESRLALDKDQVVKVRAIFDAQHPRFVEIMREVQPELRALHDRTDAEIRKVLRPEQAAKLDELRREWEKEHPWDAPKR